MASVTVIPTSTDPQDPRYVQRTQIGGIDYLLFFRFNGRENRWFVDVTDTDQNSVVAGLKLVNGTVLNVNLPFSLQPGKGNAVLQILDSLDADPMNQRDPGLGELGGRFLVTVLENG